MMTGYVTLVDIMRLHSHKIGSTFYVNTEDCMCIFNGILVNNDDFYYEFMKIGDNTVVHISCACGFDSITDSKSTITSYVNIYRVGSKVALKYSLTLEEAEAFAANNKHIKFYVIGRKVVHEYRREVV